VDAFLRPRGRWGASTLTLFCVRTDATVRADGSVFFTRVTSKWTLQCGQVTDTLAAIVRPSVRPSVIVRVTTLVECSAGLEWDILCLS
jgi:hypothetical protein